MKLRKFSSQKPSERRKPQSIVLEKIVSKHLYLSPRLLVAQLINTNIIILALYLFQISPNFGEKTRRLMTISQKPCQKKVISPITLSKDNKNRLYIRAKKSNQNLVQINHAFVQTLKQELAKILQSKEESFHMKLLFGSWTKRSSMSYLICI